MLMPTGVVHGCAAACFGLYIRAGFRFHDQSVAVMAAGVALSPIHMACIPRPTATASSKPRVWQALPPPAHVYVMTARLRYEVAGDLDTGALERCAHSGLVGLMARRACFAAKHATQLASVTCWAPLARPCLAMQHIGVHFLWPRLHLLLQCG